MYVVCKSQYVYFIETKVLCELYKVVVDSLLDHKVQGLKYIVLYPQVKEQGLVYQVE